MSLLQRFQAFINGFMPPGLATESQEAFRIQTLIATLLLVGTSGFPFMVLFFAIGHPKEALVILCLLFMTIPLLAKRRLTSNTLAQFLLAGNYYQCHSFLALIWGGIDAPNIMWFVAMPIVSVLVEVASLMGSCGVRAYVVERLDDLPGRTPWHRHV